MKNKNQQSSIDAKKNHDGDGLVKSESKGDQLLSNLFRKKFPIINDPTPKNPEINETKMKNNGAQHSTHIETGDENLQPEKAAFEAYENAIKLLPKD